MGDQHRQPQERTPERVGLREDVVPQLRGARDARLADEERGAPEAQEDGGGHAVAVEVEGQQGGVVLQQQPQQRRQALLKGRGAVGVAGEVEEAQEAGGDGPQEPHGVRDVALEHQQRPAELAEGGAVRNALLRAERLQRHLRGMGGAGGGGGGWRGCQRSDVDLPPEFSSRGSMVSND